MAAIAESAAAWPAGVSARRDMALLLVGFAGAHRRQMLALAATTHPGGRRRRTVREHQ